MSEGSYIGLVYVHVQASGPRHIDDIEVNFNKTRCKAHNANECIIMTCKSVIANLQF